MPFLESSQIPGFSPGTGTAYPIIVNRQQLDYWFWGATTWSISYSLVVTQTFTNTAGNMTISSNASGEGSLMLPYGVVSSAFGLIPLPFRLMGNYGSLAKGTVTALSLSPLPQERLLFGDGASIDGLNPGSPAPYGTETTIFTPPPPSPVTTTLKGQLGAQFAFINSASGLDVGTYGIVRDGANYYPSIVALLQFYGDQAYGPGLSPASSLSNFSNSVVPSGVSCTFDGFDIPMYQLGPQAFTPYGGTGTCTTTGLLMVTSLR